MAFKIANITARVGPGLQAVTSIIDPLEQFTVDIRKQLIYVKEGDTPSVREFDLTGVTTITFVLGVNLSITVS